jgi:hypothetical protein
MWSIARPRLRRTLTVIPAAVLLATTGAISSAEAASASASSGSTITVTYKVKGSTFIKSVNATTALGPGKLVAKVSLSTAKLTANLSLPAATVSFKELGIIPVIATTKLVQDGRTTGQINVNTGAVKTTSKITLQLTSLSIAGLNVPLPAACESATPAVIKLASQKGFSVLKGGNLAGTYTIPPVADCGLLTPLLNLIFPGPGNTITLGAAKAG